MSQFRLEIRQRFLRAKQVRLCRAPQQLLWLQLPANGQPNWGHLWESNAVAALRLRPPLWPSICTTTHIPVAGACSQAQPATRGRGQEECWSIWFRNVHWGIKSSLTTGLVDRKIGKELEAEDDTKREGTGVREMYQALFWCPNQGLTLWFMIQRQTLQTSWITWPAKFRLGTREEGGHVTKKKKLHGVLLVFQFIFSEALTSESFPEVWRAEGGNDELGTESILTQISTTSSLNTKSNSFGFVLQA